MEMEIYNKWSDVPTEYKTKTQWSNEGLRIKKGESGIELGIRDFRYLSVVKYFEFFTAEQTEPKRIVKRKELELEVDDTLLVEALYVINKSAKKSRETKKENYNYGRHGIVSSSKLREQRLYLLKDKAIEKMIAEGILEYKGYHLQETAYGVSFLKLYAGHCFSFHVPCDEKPEGEVLGSIGVISAEATIKTRITFSHAEKVLKEYTGVDPKNEILSKTEKFKEFSWCW